MPAGSVLLRLIGVAAFGAAPIAALDATPAGPITTGDAIAEGPGLGFDNTGGNVSLDNGEVVQGPAGPSVVPAAPELGAKALIAPVKPVNPAADALARANKLVADAKARTQALIDAARAKADEAVEHAHQQAADAQSHGQSQSDAARQRSDNAAAQAHN